MSHLTAISPPDLSSPHRSWTGLSGSATALAIAEAAQSCQGVCLVITPDTRSAEQLSEEMAFFNTDQIPLLSFPHWETLPYDNFSPHRDIVSERLKTLYRLPSLSKGLLIVPMTTLMQRIAPKEFILTTSLVIKSGESLDRQRMRLELVENGYRQVDTVYEHGEFAVRGSIIDIFPMGTQFPFRIDLLDDEIDQLRTFDPDSQRSLEKIDSIEILPAHEFPFDKQSISLFRQNWRATFESDPNGCPVYQDVSSELTPPGIEYYLPLFFEQCSNLLDYLPATTQIFTLEKIEDAAESYWMEINARYQQRRLNPEQPILPPESLFLPVDHVFGKLKPFRRIRLEERDSHDGKSSDDKGVFVFNCRPAPIFNLDHHSDNPLEDVEAYIRSSKSRLLFCAETAGRKEILQGMLRQINVQPTEHQGWQSFLNSSNAIAITTAALDRGLQLPDSNIAIITESQLFGEKVLQRRRRSKTSDQNDLIIKNLAELQLDAPVVHIDHGVGRYRGLETLTISGQAEEFLTLEYAAEARLYVPISSLHLIARFAGSNDETAPLHSLGSDKWQKAKRKAAEQVRDTAAELLDIHARRAQRKGFAFHLPELEYQRFCSDFPFEETPDQVTAIVSTIKDMCAATPMDRLICGDVGFGKTEVAMRAAFVASLNSRQVAILVPTTLLAQQHYESFSDRFADWPVNVAVISRFQSREEQNRTLEKIENGQIDILIATHKLIMGDFHFKDLGLVIIDEEHRFGVRQKEKLKALRAEVDILTLTATPIPRTLNMAMTGIRDISIIASPPEKRLSINTFIHRDDDAVRREAISRELLRGGQVYLLYNEVSSIERKARKIAELIPEARIGIAHGQMRERDLEKVMSDFYHKRFNLLICTTIIETGIDIPTANTIIIERADKFGLAQLHQLRGRVGRSHHQAYAYLLTPHTKTMTANAKKRLEAIAEAQELGAGFMLASHDLEIRGAGEFLGDNQSGHIQTIGFTLYSELLEQAVNTLKQGKAFNLDQPMQHGTEINLHCPALIPDSYLPDVHARLVIYKRIANASNDNDLKELQVEMIDRFGLLPDATKNLFEITTLKIKAQPLGINKIQVHNQGGKIEFSSDTQVQPQRLVSLIQEQPGLFKLEGASQLKFNLAMPDMQSRIKKTHLLLDQLA